MPLSGIDPVSLIVVVACIALLPIAIVMTTSFLKISVVLALLRNAIGVQQVPPNMALNGLALILSAYVMAPVLGSVVEQVRQAYPALSAVQAPERRFDDLLVAVDRGLAPMRAFMLKHSTPAQRRFFIDNATALWGEDPARGLQEDNLLILIPSFMVAQLNAAFQVGFLLYLPFIIIDLIVSNILLAMGMMMVSPVTIAIPLKLFLFVMVDGWTKLIQGLVLSYV
jgi:type III secretion protein R